MLLRKRPGSVDPARAGHLERDGRPSDPPAIFGAGRFDKRLIDVSSLQDRGVLVR